jgi:hypothetical protein
MEEIEDAVLSDLPPFLGLSSGIAILKPLGTLLQLISSAESGTGISTLPYFHPLSGASFGGLRATLNKYKLMFEENKRMNRVQTVVCHFSTTDGTV